MKTVITYGTFDLFHVGHVRLLRRLRALGDRLIVGCSTDEFNDIKGKQSIFSYDDRSEIVKSCEYVDDVFPENNWDQKVDDVIKYKADIFAMGDDWIGKFDFLEAQTGCTVTYLARTPDISTTQVKSVVAKIDEERKAALVNQISALLDHVQKL
ncbi:adenylyltransferase/cytidyltransferase family protein [Sulfitobacter sp. S190]|uniref:adenylyltransferase/cytidyltransferase family protein n=1 Tax=Sulfitobacter sp. S190 TaxID=2867022 RepID=UPI0021A555DC|nr:adenylyltransferase/cytidyltransferase family protein [Sulfitobacter sp. S190]UWR24285.1 adenylyltransferase/cytidyltransferase family protein [Sulfitobacter sp. S190]